MLTITQVWLVAAVWSVMEALGFGPTYLTVPLVALHLTLVALVNTMMEGENA